MKAAANDKAPTLLPNLGAEEGDDWRAFFSEPRVRLAARLWSHLFSNRTRFRLPDRSTGSGWTSRPCIGSWPDVLGPAPGAPVFDWLETPRRPIAWLKTKHLEDSVRDTLGSELAGPPAHCVADLHDKAFAARTADELGLVPPSLGALIQILTPEELRSPDALIRRLDAALLGWPDWTERRFTLKPRHGTSGRGRIGGRETTDTDAIRGALPRLAERGGAIFEPWLSRRTDLSVTLYVPPTAASESHPTLLGSLEMLVTPGGVFRGHRGEVDSRGRIFSGHQEDERLRADAAATAARAREAGFVGPCGIDALSYLEGDRERMRSLVEFNARTTMGLVTIGLVRRALPLVRERLDLTPGERRAFFLGIAETSGDQVDDPHRTLDEPEASGPLVLDLGPAAEGSPLRAFLVFGRDAEQLHPLQLEWLRC